MQIDVFVLMTKMEEEDIPQLRLLPQTNNVLHLQTIIHDKYLQE